MTRLLTILLAGVLTLGAQSIRWGQIRTSETGVFNVKTAPFNAKGDGVTDDTAAIQAALVAGAGKVVYFPPGTYKVSSSLVPAAGTTIRGETGQAQTTTSNTKIYYYDADTPLFQVDTDSVLIEGFYLSQHSSVPATTGNFGIRTRNSGSAGAYHAVIPRINNVLLVGFHIGVEIDGTFGGGGDRVSVFNAVSHGFKFRNAQSFWSKLQAIACGGHGVYATSSAFGQGGPNPWIDTIETFGNGGWGVYIDYAGFNSFTNYFLNNDSLGEFYHSAAGLDVLWMENGVIQWSGANPFSSMTTSAGASLTDLNQQVIAATNANPIEIELAGPHGLAAPASVDCYRIAGNTAANGTFTATPVVGQPNKFTLGGTIGNGALSIPATCPTGSSYGFECPKCSLAATPYRSLPTAPGIYIAATSGPGRVSGTHFFSTNGNAYENLAAGQKLSDSRILGGGGAAVASAPYAIKSTNAVGMDIDGVNANTPAYLEGADTSVANSSFSSIVAAVPALQVGSGLRARVANNSLYHGAGGQALQLDSGVTVERSENIVIGGQTNNSTTSPQSRAIGTTTTAAGLATTAQQWGICTDCKPTSEVDNSCAAGGTGAFFFLDPAGTWRCVKTTSSPAVVTVALTARNAAITTADLVAAASVTAGTYRASAYIHTTTASAGACTSDVTIGWTYNSAAKTKSPISSFNQAIDENFGEASVTFRAAAGAAITYAVSRSGGDCSSNVYDIYIVLERIQ